MTYRVGLVDDHEIVAVALAGVIDGLPQLEFAGVAATVDELLTTLSDLDVVVLDLRLADGSSPVNNVARLDAMGINVLAFTSGENPYLVRLVSQTAVLGVIRKSEPVAVLAEALERVAESKPVVSTDWAAALDSDPKLGEARLSPREQHILALFAGGNKTQAVASEAGIAIGTVDDYVRRIRAKYAKIGRHAPSKVDLYKRAVEDGFLPPPGNE
jgi:DNA-binding NarL/FixJ family response regulator